MSNLALLEMLALGVRNVRETREARDYRVTVRLCLGVLVEQWCCRWTLMVTVRSIDFLGKLWSVSMVRECVYLFMAVMGVLAMVMGVLVFCGSCTLLCFVVLRVVSNCLLFACSAGHHKGGHLLTKEGLIMKQWNSKGVITLPNGEKTTLNSTNGTNVIGIRLEEKGRLVAKMTVHEQVEGDEDRPHPVELEIVFKCKNIAQSFKHGRNAMV